MGQTVAVKGAQEDIRAPRPDFTVPINVAISIVMRIIASRQLETESLAAGHILGKPGVDALQPDVAQTAPFQGYDLIAGGSPSVLKSRNI